MDLCTAKFRPYLCGKAKRQGPWPSCSLFNVSELYSAKRLKPKSYPRLAILSYCGAAETTLKKFYYFFSLHPLCLLSSTDLNMGPWGLRVSRIISV